MRIWALLMRKLLKGPGQGRVLSLWWHKMTCLVHHSQKENNRDRDKDRDIINIMNTGKKNSQASLTGMWPAALWLMHIQCFSHIAGGSHTPQSWACLWPCDLLPMKCEWKWSNPAGKSLKSQRFVQPHSLFLPWQLWKHLQKLSLQSAWVPEMRNPYTAMTDLQQGEEMHVAISATGSFVMFVMAAWPALY